MTVLDGHFAAGSREAVDELLVSMDRCGVAAAIASSGDAETAGLNTEGNDPVLDAARTHPDSPRTGLANMLAAVGPKRMVFCGDHPFGHQAFGLRCTSRIEMEEAARERVLGRNLYEMLPPPLRSGVGVHEH